MDSSFQNFEAHVRKILDYLEELVGREMVEKADSDEDSESREL